MARHGLLQMDMALICGVTPRSIRNWTQGKTEVPLSAILLMRAFDEGRIDMAWLASAIKAHRAHRAHRDAH